MLGRAIAISMVGAIVLLAVLLQTTTPATIGPLGILFVFILLYVSVLGVLTFLLFGCSRIIAKLASSIIVRKSTIQPLTLGRAYYYSSVLALAPVLFIGMQSVGEVSIYDVVLVVLFVVIACIYIAKRTR
ncbi:MAG TPA: hypothetical protein VFS14_01030 [Candidatus Saccharimonadales bacterium]|nr:hypothetical protein [Candidatus Saccharimonadales bacterium]